MVCGRWPTLFILQRQVVLLPFIPPTRARDRLVLPSSIIFAASILKATRPPAFRPAVLQSTCRELHHRVLEIDANHPTSPAFCGLSQESTFPSLQTLFCHGGRKQVSIRPCLVHVL